MPCLLESRVFYWIATDLRLQFNQIGKDIRLPPQLVGNGIVELLSSQRRATTLGFAQRRSFANHLL
jgi:hypothetical protein